jgi:hypothetical protein
MITDRVKFYGGLGMIATFLIMLAIMFSPIFGDRNAMEYADELYNSISKHSAYYIPDVKEHTAEHSDVYLSTDVKMKDQQQAHQTAQLYRKSGVEVNASGPNLIIQGSLGLILDACLSDADAMYFNNGASIKAKYGYDEKRVLYNWWESLNAIDKKLIDQDLFDESNAIKEVLEKAVEPAYNYYGIEPQTMGDRIGVVLFSLIFYVAYTVWYGLGLMFIIEGLGIKIRHMYPFRFVGRISLN